jgi:glycosyltransferase involved in cell wall biosynthesis
MKGFDALIVAAARVATTVPDLRLTFAGDGSQRFMLEALASRLGIRDRVTFAGWRTPEQVRCMLSTATMLVHPSAGLGDAVPTVIKEALAVGTPVVASDVAGIPELLDHGACGVLVPAASPEPLAAAVSALLLDSARQERYAAAGRAHAEAMFDIRRNGPRLAAILRHTTRARERTLGTPCVSSSAAAS